MSAKQAAREGREREMEIYSAIKERKGLRWARVVEMAANGLKTLIFATQHMPEEASGERVSEHGRMNILMLAVLAVVQTREDFDEFGTADEELLRDIATLHTAQIETMADIIEASLP